MNSIKKVTIALLAAQAIWTVIIVIFRKPITTAYLKFFLGIAKELNQPTKAETILHSKRVIAKRIRYNVTFTKQTK